MQGGTATFALPAQSVPNYIFPLTPIANYSLTNGSFQFMLYRPLYMFGIGRQAVLNDKLSVADKPQYSSDGKTVTMHLRNYNWSDGKPVTARDVEFWHNLVKFNKDQWAAYVPGGYPDNVVATKIVDDKTIQFTLDKGYSTGWYTYNELSQITPLPQHIMDKTSPTAAVGDSDRTAAGAKAVYAYLNGEAKKLSSYATNPLWKVVDGPWKLSRFDTTGHTEMVPNPAYTGPVKPRLAKFVMLPFTSDTSEFNQLRSGTSITYGYIPARDISQKDRLTRYTHDRWLLFGINFSLTNLHNPQVGPIFSQTYIRQVLEQLINQKGVLKAYYSGLGVETCGPVPIVPPNPFASAHEKSCPFRYDPKAAIATLKAHGWNVVPNGVTTCASPGTGPANCGAGIAQGAKMQFTYLYATGNTSFDNSVKQTKSEAAKAGIVYNLKGQPFNDVICEAVPCKSTEKTCSWEMANFGGWVYVPDYYPSGELLWQTGAGSNASNYSDPKADRLIIASTLAGANAQQTLTEYQDYLTDQVPYIWTENTDYAQSMIDKRLQGAVPQNAYGSIFPEEWYFTK